VILYKQSWSDTDPFKSPREAGQKGGPRPAYTVEVTATGERHSSEKKRSFSVGPAKPSIEVDPSPPVVLSNRRGKFLLSLTIPSTKNKSYKEIMGERRI